MKILQLQKIKQIENVQIQCPIKNVEIWDANSEKYNTMSVFKSMSM